MGEDGKTLEKILQAAEEEFLEKGFQRASLRKIVSQAGVTTGAFYRYFPTKEALFETLVEPHAARIMELFSEAFALMDTIPAKRQTGAMMPVTAHYIERILDYIYEHYQQFKLLLCSAGGTRYENFVHNIVEKEVDATYRYLDVLKSLGRPVPEMERELCHMISSGMYAGMFEIVVHDMEKEAALKRIRQLQEFHIGGWERILGVKFEKEK